MSRHVYRSEFPVLEETTIELNGPVLHVACRREDVVEIWHLFDTEQPTTSHAFSVVGTGHQVPDDLTNYVGSAVTPSGRFVWHLFEAAKPVLTTTPCDGKCGSADPHDAHLTPEARAHLAGGPS